MKMTYEKNWLEWLVLVTGTCLVVIILGLLIYEAVNLEKTPPVISVALGSPEFKEGHFLVPVQAKNMGTQTAEDVRIEIISGKGASQERSEIHFAYFPGNAVQNGWVTFTKDPEAKGRLHVHILGYSTP